MNSFLTFSGGTEIDKPSLHFRDTATLLKKKVRPSFSYTRDFIFGLILMVSSTRKLFLPH